MADSFENYLKAQENLGRLQELKKGAAMDSVVDRLAKAFNCNLVTRKEYDELFLAITRLTDRIEALEKGLLGDGR